jgi:hypothetical protein
MRRGLMGWDKDELPQAALDERLARLRSAMERDRLDALLIYTNLVRPSAVSWLTGFTPYWIDSILLVRREGAPLLATALSKRVADWVRTTASLGEIVNTPRPGTAVGQRLAAEGCRRVGILELDGFPAGHYDEITAAAPAVELVDASATFAAARRPVDAAERSLIAQADRLARAALEQVDAQTADNAGALAGLVEKHARLGAAEEAYIAVAPDLAADRRLIRMSGPGPLGNLFAVRASIAYKGHWVRRTRTFAKDADARAAVARGDAWLEQLAGALSGDAPPAAQIAAQLKTLHGAELKGWMVESCIGSYPLEVVASSHSAAGKTPHDGAFLVLSVELAIDGIPWLGAAPAFVGGERR